MALVTWAFERAVTKKPMLRSRQAPGTLGAPGRVGPHHDGSLHEGRVVAAPVTERDLAWQLGDGGVEDAHVVGHGVGPGVARTQERRQHLAGGIGEAEHRVEAKPALVRGRRRTLSSVWISTSEASMSRSTGSLPLVAPARRQTSARTSAIGFGDPAPRRGVISWKVRKTVESDGTEPNRSSWSRRCSMSAQLSPPPASISAVCTRTLPRSCSGKRSPRGGIRAESESPSPNRSAKAPRACSPTWATTPAPPGSTTTRRVLVPFTLEVPSWFGCCCVDNNSFPYMEGFSADAGRSAQTAP